MSYYIKQNWSVILDIVLVIVSQAALGFVELMYDSKLDSKYDSKYQKPTSNLMIYFLSVQMLHMLDMLRC